MILFVFPVNRKTLTTTRMIKTKNGTDFVFPKRNFWTGFGSVLNIGGDSSKSIVFKSDEDADYKALKSDWDAIGNDFYSAMFETLKK